MAQLGIVYIYPADHISVNIMCSVTYVTSMFLSYFHFIHMLWKRTNYVSFCFSFKHPEHIYLIMFAIIYMQHIASIATLTFVNKTFKFNEIQLYHGLLMITEQTQKLDFTMIHLYLDIKSRKPNNLLINYIKLL